MELNSYLPIDLKKKTKTNIKSLIKAQWMVISYVAYQLYETHQNICFR